MNDRIKVWAEQIKGANLESTVEEVFKGKLVQEACVYFWFCLAYFLYGFVVVTYF